ncbi:hypothetical protein [Peribacillus simplex]
MGKKALITIDYTYDFVADGGSLTCGNVTLYCSCSPFKHGK